MPKALARGSACLLLILFALLSSRVAHAATVANGGFETGDFTGWTTATTCGAAGSWNVYTGTTALSASPIDAPPQGTHAAVTDSPLLTASTQILYQDLQPRSRRQACPLLLPVLSGLLRAVPYTERSVAYFQTTSTGWT